MRTSPNFCFGNKTGHIGTSPKSETPGPGNYANKSIIGEGLSKSFGGHIKFDGFSKER